MILKDVADCSTYAVRGLDNQLIWQMNQISPGLLVRIDDLDVSLGDSVHPWLQKAAKPGLRNAISARGQTLVINSAYRTLAGQALLYKHYCNGNCGITAAARPGLSNHNNASAIDVEDSDGWRDYLQGHSWSWLGAFDQMHYDCEADGIRDIKTIAVNAFQVLWNRANPGDRISVDGDFGDNTNSKLLNSPAEGFGDLPCPRILRLTDPVQQGKDVGALQLALREAGLTVSADMVFGQGTADAVKKFQDSNKLTPDGVVGTVTAKLLKLPSVA